MPSCHQLYAKGWLNPVVRVDHTGLVSTAVNRNFDTFRKIIQQPSRQQIAQEHMSVVAIL